MLVKQLQRFKVTELPPLRVSCQVKSCSLGANLFHANLKFPLSVKEVKEEGFLCPRVLLETLGQLGLALHLDCCEEQLCSHQ